MGLKKVSKLIEKINVLHDSLLSIDDQISSIEKDLLLNYIRQLYEQVLEITTEEKKSYSDPVNFKQEMTVSELKKVVTTPIVPEVKSSETKAIDQEQPSEIIETLVVIESIEKEELQDQLVKDSHSENQINSELIEMFDMKEARELSEKLSNSPIKDLSTAIGINDRFLTINDLFGGDSNAFKDCIDQINKMTSYDEAKSYLLSSTAQIYDWSSTTKLKKAAGFISLVQRRFR